MKQGDQIAYIPPHAKGNIKHPDVEFGFIAQAVLTGYGNSERDTTYFCRFWRKGEPGVLRTTANAERCYDYQIKHHISVDQSLVWKTLRELGYKVKE